MILGYHDFKPEVHSSAFVAETAVVIGDVKIGEDSSVWYGAVLRGDINHIKIGKRTSIQDTCVVHVDFDNSVDVGNDVTVGHGAILHGCTVGNCVLIGIGAKLLDGSKVGDGAIIAAGSVVREDQEVPPRTLVAGIPAKPKRELSEQTLEMLLEHARSYAGLARDYAKL
jgi:carbonic anhydrase/acetyltransferase-like protein (isoleucine patch superfamily)